MKKIKEWFSTPKKAAVSCAVIAGCLLVLGTGTAFAASTVAENTSIGVAAAQNFAFADAGVDPAAAYVDHTEFDFERGQFVYEVEFIADGTEYEYWIKASDGTVVKKETKLISANGSNVATADQITLEEAQTAALTDAGVAAADATFTEGKLDYDDGLALYDVDFYTADAKYAYEINAATGAVFSRSKETVSYQTDASAQDSTQTAAPVEETTGSSIGSSTGSTATVSDVGAEAAKAAALADAGFTEDQVYLTKCEADYDDGVLCYEIEFCCNGWEYDYEIHGETCAVRSKDVEACDHDNHRNCDNDGICDGSGSGYGAAGTAVDLEQAKTICLNHAGCTADQAAFSKAKLDYDDGLAVYEIEFYCNGSEHEYKVDCATGAILEYECEGHHNGNHH